MNTIDVLRGMREKIAQGWTQGVGARDKNGKVVGCTDPSATCWCVIGAAYAVVTGHPMLENAMDDVLDAFSAKAGRLSSPYNDAPGRTQAEVLSVIDQAIESCKEEA